MIGGGAFGPPQDPGFVGAPAVVAVLLFSMIFAHVLDACSARADEEPQHVTLARTCVSEASWGAIESGDCAAIAEIGRRVGRGDVARGLRLYARSAHNTARTDRRRWVAHLDGTLEQPEGWPANLSWDRHSPLFDHVLEGSKRILAGELRHGCSETPWHWGGAMDRHRAVRNRWRQIDCGATVNEFWVLR